MAINPYVATRGGQQGLRFCNVAPTIVVMEDGMSQSRKDALADAETLRTFYRSERIGAGIEGPAMTALLSLAVEPTMAPRRFKRAARAAFNAVPGLRGMALTSAITRR